MPHELREHVISVDRRGGAGLLGILAACHLRSIPQARGSGVPCIPQIPGVSGPRTHEEKGSELGLPWLVWREGKGARRRSLGMKGIESCHFWKR
jgi:hypothetical protein